LADLAEVLRLGNRTMDAAAAAEAAQRLYEQKGNIVASRRVRSLLDELTAGVPTVAGS